MICFEKSVERRTCSGQYEYLYYLFPEQRSPPLCSLCVLTFSPSKTFGPTKKLVPFECYFVACTCQTLWMAYRLERKKLIRKPRHYVEKNDGVEKSDLIFCLSQSM
jgi:hypothetical protein